MTQTPSRILNYMYGSTDAVLLDPNARDGACDPYLKLRDRCAELGYSFEDVDGRDLEEARWLCFWDAWLPAASGPLERAVVRGRVRRAGGTRRDVLREARRRGLEGRLALFMYEPPSVCPGNFDLAAHEPFSVIFTWDPDLVDNQRYFHIHLPSPTVYPRPEPVPFAQRKLLVDVSSYNFYEHPRGLNHERRRTVRFFEEHYPADFDLYGAGWNPSFSRYVRKKILNRNVRYEHYPSYRGPIASKADVLPRYRFSLCYENIVDQKGFVSVKIFDSLRLGAVPVYLGAPDIAEYVDADAFVDRRNFATLDELGRYLASVDEEEHARYLEAARVYLESPRFRRFLDVSFVDVVTRTLGLDERGAERDISGGHSAPRAPYAQK